MHVTNAEADSCDESDVFPFMYFPHHSLGLSPGDQPFPCLAAYGASKAALNLLTNTLRHELEPWGVDVSTILPSSYKTGNFFNSYAAM